jgi:hypothetical protein
LEERNREQLRALVLNHVVAGRSYSLQTEIPERLEAVSGETVSVAVSPAA